jgi:hypothetical protein
VKNIYDPLLNNYQEVLTPTCGASLCQITAPAVTKTTLIQHVSCGFSMLSSAIVTNAFLSNANSPPINVLNPFIFATSGSRAERGINADTFLIFKKGMTPEIDIVTSGDVAGTVICKLSGYHQ